MCKNCLDLERQNDDDDRKEQTDGIDADLKRIDAAADMAALAAIIAADGDANLALDGLVASIIILALNMKWNLDVLRNRVSRSIDMAVSVLVERQATTTVSKGVN